MAVKHDRGETVHGAAGRWEAAQSIKGVDVIYIYTLPGQADSDPPLSTRLYLPTLYIAQTHQWSIQYHMPMIQVSPKCPI